MPVIPQRNTPTMTTNLEDLKSNHGLNSTSLHQMNDPACSNNYQNNNNNHVYSEYSVHNSRGQNSVVQSQMNSMQQHLNGSGLTHDIDQESIENEVNISTNKGLDLCGPHSYNTGGIYGSSMGNFKNSNFIQNKPQTMSKEDMKSLSGGSSLNSQFSGANSHSTNHMGNESSGNIKTMNHSNKENFLTNYYGDDSTLPRPRENLIGNGGDDPGDGLGPLPPKWETAYTERGELYFIDHNTGTSHWLDPRLSKYQKKSLEDCSEDELPYGWEKIEDSLYGTYFIDHVNRKTQYENPVLEAKRRAAEQKQKLNEMQQRSQTPSSHSNKINLNEGPASSTASTIDIAHRNNLAGSDQVGPGPPINRPILPCKFTRNPNEVPGERIITSLIKSMRGLGITIVGGEGVDGVEEFLQIKSIVPNSPAWMDGRLQTGDILIYVNNICVLGFTHNEMVKVFQSILPGEVVTLQVSRGYSLPFDPNDPNTEVVTTIAVDSDPLKQQNSLLELNSMGKFNFLNSSTRNNLKDIPILDNSGFILMKKPETYTFSIKKGTMGFGFTITDSAQGQKVKKILDRNCCTDLQEGDILLEINEIDVRHKTHSEVVQILKECSKTEATLMKISRASANDSLDLYGGEDSSGNVAKLRKNFGNNFGIYRSKTPTADLYSTQQKELLPMRPKTPLVDTRRRVKTPNNELIEDAEVAAAISNGNLKDGLSQPEGKLKNALQDLDIINQEIPFMDPYPKMVTSLSERLAGVSLASGSLNENSNGRLNVDSQDYFRQNKPPFNGNFALPEFNRHVNVTTSLSNESQNLLIPTTSANSIYYGHHESCFCFSCQESSTNKFRQNSQRNIYGQQTDLVRNPHTMQYLDGVISLPAEHHQNERMQRRVNELLNSKNRFGVYSSVYESQNSPNLYRGGGMVAQQQLPPQQLSPALSSVSQQQPGPSWNSGLSNDIYATHGVLDVADDTQQYELSEVTLERQALGFGFRIVGGTEEGSQVTIGHIVPGGAADNDHRINTGDEILSIDGINVVNASHHKVVQLMGEAALRGQVTMILRRRLLSLVSLPQINQSYSQNSPIIRYPYEVSVSRTENEGFGFVIISSSNQYYGSTIGKLIPGSPADRCGELKVGDRIIAVNAIDIIGMMHGDVVNLIKESGLQVQLTIGCPMKDLSTGNSILHSPNSAQSSPSGLSQTTSMMTAPLNQPMNQRSHLASPNPQQQQHQQSQQQQKL